MNRDEAKEVVKRITYAYPSFKPMSMSEMVDMWTEMFECFDVNVVMAALKTYVATDTSGFAPAIGKIMEIIRSFQTAGTEEMSDLEAWSLVRTAIKDGTYHSAERFDELPKIVQKVVGSPGNLREWAGLDSKEVSTVIQSHFLKSYRVEVKRQQDYRSVPEEVKAFLEGGSKRCEGIGYEHDEHFALDDASGT